MMLMWIVTGRPSSTAAAQNGSSSRREALVAGRPVRDEHALRAARLGLAQPVDRAVDADRRDLRHADEPLRVGRAELLEQEVVVGLDAGEHEVFVVVAEEVAHRALRREQDLGRDAVDVHVLEALGAVVATGARLFVGDAVPAELVERHARRRRRARSDRASPPTAVSHASPPSKSLTSFGAFSCHFEPRWFFQMSGGSRMWQSASTMREFDMRCVLLET